MGFFSCKKKKKKDDSGFSYWHDEFLENAKPAKLDKKKQKELRQRKLSTFSQKQEETKLVERGKSRERKLLDSCFDEEWLLAKMAKEAQSIDDVERILKEAQQLTFTPLKEKAKEHAQLGQANYRFPWGYVATQNEKPSLFLSLSLYVSVCVCVFFPVFLCLCLCRCLCLCLCFCFCL